MTKDDLGLRQLDDKTLRQRIAAAQQRLHRMETELWRRVLLDKYGTETPALKTFYVSVEAASLTLAIDALDETEARQIADEELVVYWSHPNIMLTDGMLVAGDIEPEDTAEAA
jgi:hypothetical protein